MKTILNYQTWKYLLASSLALFFFLVSMLDKANAANWYVDNTVATSGSGQSWATAFKNFSNIIGHRSTQGTLFILVEAQQAKHMPKD